MNFLYFALVLLFSMCLMHPVSLCISLAGAVSYQVLLNGRKGLRFSLVFMLPMMLFAALVNPVFNHEGATILTYLPSGNPLTAESIWYGLAAFALFRFFDIVKPCGVRQMESMPGGVGVMMDDVLAGIYGFAVLYIVQYIILPFWG